jgi:hypothetical protein
MTRAPKQVAERVLFITGQGFSPDIEDTEFDGALNPEDRGPLWRSFADKTADSTLCDNGQ